MKRRRRPHSDGIGSHENGAALFFASHGLVVTVHVMKEGCCISYASEAAAGMNYRSYEARSRDV